MKDVRTLGGVLLFNLILNSEALTNLQSTMKQEKDVDRTFASLTAPYLYPRVVSDIDFDKLSEEDKTAFTFLAKEKEGFYNKKHLRDAEMPMFVQAAHINTCGKLGVKPTKVIPCSFGEGNPLNPGQWVTYSSFNGNIYINADKDYSIARPSFLLENVNAATRQHSIYQNIFASFGASAKPLSDRDFFLAVFTAVKNYVYQDLRENDPDVYSIQLGCDYATPDIIDQTLYSFQKTRQDFQAAGIYGGVLQQRLRQNEQLYHEHMQRELITNTLTNVEDIFSYFKQSPLNQSSNGLLGKILDCVERSCAASFFNSVGAEMEPDQSITEYIDQLEQEMFDEYGIEMPTKEELEHFVATGDSGGPDDPDEEFSDEEEYPEGEDLSQQGFGVAVFGVSEEDDMPRFKPLESVLPPEGKIDNIKDLPFHNYPQQNLGAQTEGNAQ